MGKGLSDAFSDGVHEIRDFMDRVIAMYDMDFLHKFLTEPELLRGFTSKALERVWQLNEDRWNEYVKGHAKC